MIYEVLIEFAQGFSRGLLILRSNLAGDLSAPEQVIANHNSALAELWQSQIKIATIFLFDRIDEDEIESFSQLRDHFQCVPFVNVDAFTEAGPRIISFGGGNHFVARIDG